MFLRVDLLVINYIPATIYLTWSWSVQFPARKRLISLYSKSWHSELNWSQLISAVPKKLNYGLFIEPTAPIHPRMSKQSIIQLPCIKPEKTQMLLSLRLIWLAQILRVKSETCDARDLIRKRSLFLRVMIGMPDHFSIDDLSVITKYVCDYTFLEQRKQKSSWSMVGSSKGD